MAKRIISIFLCLIMLLSVIPLTAFAQEKSETVSEEEIELTFELYKESKANIDTDLCLNPDKLWYMSLEKEIEEKSYWIKKGMDITVGILKVQANKERCVEILANLVSAIESDTALEIEKQSSFDKTKDVQQYGMDIMDILVGSIDDIDSYKKLKAAINGTNDLKDLTVESIETVKYYEALFKSYERTNLLLTCIWENTTYEPLKEAVGAMLNYTELEFTQRLQKSNELTENVLKYVGKQVWEYFEYIAKVLEDTELEDAYHLIAFCKSTFFKGLKKLNLGIKIGVFACDMIFKSTDEFNRQQEIKVLYEIANSIFARYNKIDVNLENPNEKNYNKLVEKVNLCQLLCAVHMRGEYCFYNLLIKDGGVQSVITQFAEAIKILRDENSLVDDYEKRIEIISSFSESLKDIFDNAKIEIEFNNNSSTQESSSEYENNESTSANIKAEIIKHRRTLIDGGATCAIAVKKDGKVICTQDFSKSNSSKYICGDINTWSDIVEVSMSPFGDFVVGLKSDGTVVALGDNMYGQCNVSEWKDIVKIDTTDTFTTGLKKDGTVVFTDNEYLNIIDQKIKDIRLSDSFNIGAITEDNIFISSERDDNDEIFFEEKTKDCISFVDGIGVWAGIKEDGTVVSNFSFEQSDLDEMRENWLDDYEDNPYYTKEETIKMRDEVCNPDDYCFSDVTTWKNVVSVTTLTIPIEFGFLVGGVTGKLIGITLDGNVLACGKRIGVENWTNISSISIDYSTAIGITKDGHGISTNPDSVVNTWTDLAVY